VMAPAQVIEPKDLPPDVMAPAALAALAAHAPAVPATEVPGVATNHAAVMEAPVAERGAANYGAPDQGIIQSAGALQPKTAIEPQSAADSAANTAPWETGLEAEAMTLLANGRTDVWDELTRRFEAKLIQTALANTKGRRIEAAVKLGIGRNTITRKIQELGLD
jgi:two-component system, NtrC family, nitrogen regulation response regulator GlnG